MITRFTNLPICRAAAEMARLGDRSRGASEVRCRNRPLSVMAAVKFPALTMRIKTFLQNVGTVGGILRSTDPISSRHD
jgi:hypothetical protein